MSRKRLQKAPGKTLLNKWGMLVSGLSVSEELFCLTAYNLLWSDVLLYLLSSQTVGCNTFSFYNTVRPSHYSVPESVETAFRGMAANVLKARFGFLCLDTHDSNCQYYY